MAYYEFFFTFQIDRLKPIRSLSRLKVLYMAHNFVRDWREFEHLIELPCLEDLVIMPKSERWNI